MSPAIARLLYGSWVNVESGQLLFPYPRRSAQKTSYRSDSSGAISLHIKCVSGKPCSNNTGIPDPDFLTNISATSVLTVVAWKLSNIAARRRGPRRGHYEPPGHLILSSRDGNDGSHPVDQNKRHENRHFAIRPLFKHFTVPAIPKISGVRQIRPNRRHSAAIRATIAPGITSFGTQTFAPPIHRQAVRAPLVVQHARMRYTSDMSSRCPSAFRCIKISG